MPLRTPPTYQDEMALMRAARRRRDRAAQHAETNRHQRAPESRAAVYKRLRLLNVAPHNALIASGIAIELKAVPL